MFKLTKEWVKRMTVQQAYRLIDQLPDECVEAVISIHIVLVLNVM